MHVCISTNMNDATVTEITTWKTSANLEYTKQLLPTPDFASCLDVKNHLSTFKFPITRMVFLICFERT